MNLTTVGRKVMAGLQKAHRIRHAEQKAQAATHLRLIYAFAQADLAQGHPWRGLPRRVRHQLLRAGYTLTERRVRTILSELRSVHPIRPGMMVSNNLEAI